MSNIWNNTQTTGNKAAANNIRLHIKDKNAELKRGVRSWR